MADKVRTKSELLALFADNTTQDISPQDCRDFIVTHFDHADDDSTNPHAVAASDVGNTTAQWNANKLQGNDIKSETLGAGQDGFVLTWDNGTSKWQAEISSALPGGVDTQIQFNDSGSFGGDSGFTTDGAGSVDITGDLDVDNININGNTIISTDTNGDINITPNGAGEIVLDGLSWPTSDGTGGYHLATDGAGNLYFDAAGGAPGGANTQIQFNSAGSFGGDSGFTTNGSGSVNITGDLDVDNLNLNGNTIISTDTNGDINLTPDGTGTVVVGTDLDVDNINIYKFNA
jgi:cytoskeletal protein CcmA (bactofilin family)